MMTAREETKEAISKAVEWDSWAYVDVAQQAADAAVSVWEPLVKLMLEEMEAETGQFVGINNPHHRTRWYFALKKAREAIHG